MLDEIPDGLNEREFRELSDALDERDARVTAMCAGMVASGIAAIHAELVKVKSRNRELEDICRKFIDAMVRYEMDADTGDDPAPYAHRAMMSEARAALKGGDDAR